MARYYSKSETFRGTLEEIEEKMERGHPQIPFLGLSGLGATSNAAKQYGGHKLTYMNDLDILDGVCLEGENEHLSSRQKKLLGVDEIYRRSTVYVIEACKYTPTHIKYVRVTSLDDPRLHVNGADTFAIAGGVLYVVDICHRYKHGHSGRRQQLTNEYRITVVSDVPSSVVRDLISSL
jgi:hypothetical protein